MNVTALSTSRPINKAIDHDEMRDACRAYLDTLPSKTSSLKFACLSTEDGRLYASACTDVGVAKRISEMASSLFAISESFSKDALQGRCAHSMIWTDQGVIVTVRVPCRPQTHVLSIGADASENQAMTLRRALDAAEQLAAVIDRVV